MQKLLIILRFPFFFVLFVLLSVCNSQSLNDRIDMTPGTRDTDLYMV